ncbi:hypothetical protein acsn021_19810 [Anaerocolumna cellulosilytica]|uniref:Uncharacterized protein n=1 Tax=Anaerocolumna cellulosilytica TaxID=433286 RepID=A0A6S6R4L6_9FIRM|nr:SDR family NAD(P)-dependent oxidoreductase [Anaerocolumna cellulosilytica]MBB5196466.1 acyl transferase domain-containing protein/NAD(P)-dependent dehydrogenase (short-subunit alcohol dehydrogenase family)/acyl carrier protein [Anaerocolumna cellulosilytica]BCJ94412.1 hypothetical protein acsn021_19810 [Anaerocolumna cellulosilytica]
MERDMKNNDIAIIGMSGIFPKARNLDEYWTNLEQGRNCISEIPLSRWDKEEYYSKEKGQNNKTYSCWGGVIENAYEFDPVFFNIAPKEAPFIDPQQRKVLEVAYEAIENAGYSPSGLENSDTGVYLGVMGRGYYDKVLADQTELEGHMFTSSLLGFLPNRISFHLNLKGPSIAIDTLCSSSLVAVHEACKSIVNGECAMALAGGVYIHFSAQHYILLSKMNVLSKEGQCKTFDESADGIVSGEGTGILLLKSYEKALQDKDHIHAVIKGSVINSDGRSSRFTTTNADAQVDMIHKVFQKTAIRPESISYLEAHGTGTKIGDPTELMALKQCYGLHTDKKGFCAIGSVKSNIGHLEPAAGIAGLIKTVLSLKKGMIPPTLHVNKMNHFIDIIDSPFIINDRLTIWNTDTVKKAGVSAFGMGGTNAHIILEEAPKAQVFKDIKKPDIFCFSAKTKKALLTLLEKFIEFFEKKETNYQEYCYTSNISKTAYPYRVAFIADSCNQLWSKLKEMQLYLSEEKDESFGNTIKDSYISHKQNSKKRIVLNVKGTFEEHIIEAAIKGFDYINQDYEVMQDYINIHNKTDKYSYDIEQMVNKYLFFKALMNYGVIPAVLVYEPKDAYLVSLLLGFSTVKECVEGMRNNQVIQLSKNHTMADGTTILLYNTEDDYSVSETDSLFITPLEGESKKAVHCFYTTLAYVYVNGIDIHWEEFYAGKDIHKAELPTYPFERQEYRIPFEKSPLKKLDNQVEELKPVAMLHEVYKSHEWGIYTIVFGKKELAYYKEHSVLGEAVLPASAYIDAVYRAGNKYLGVSIKEINDFVFLTPCVLKKGMQLHIRLEKRGETISFTLQSYYVTSDNEQWKEHAKGKLLLHTDEIPADNALLERVNRVLYGELDVEGFYNYFEYTGIAYGKSFRLLNKLYRNGLGVWSEYNTDSLNPNRKDAFSLNPSALDAALQTVVSLNFNNLDNRGEPFLPFYIKNMIIFNTEICNNGTKVIVDVSHKGESSLKSDVSIVSREGEELIKIKGFHLKQARNEPMHKKIDSFILNQCLEKQVWTKTNPDFETEYTKDNYLIFDIDSVFSETIRKNFFESGSNYIRVFPENEFQKKSDTDYRIRPGDETDVRRLLEVVNASLLRPASILFLWPLKKADNLSLNSIDSAIHEGVLTLFVLLKQMYSLGYKYKKLIVLTEEAFLISEKDKVRPASTSIWGFMRVIKREFPNLKTKVIDVNQCTDSVVEDASAVYKEIYHTMQDTEIAYRNQERYQHSLEKSNESVVGKYEKLKKDGTYIITGGTGGIGFSLVEQMEKDSNANLILLGRKNFSEVAIDKIKRMNAFKQNGSNIEYISVDITDIDTMKRVVKTLKEKYGKITGIFHTAGEIRDALLIHKSVEDFKAVLQSKIKGTLVLDTLFCNEDLQFIMLFSSVSSIDGIIGQCDYAAANAFLDGMAEAVHQTIKYQSINWSFWNVGMGAGSQKSALKNGYQVLSPEAAAKAAVVLAGTTIKRAVIANRVKSEQEKPGISIRLKEKVISPQAVFDLEANLQRLLGVILAMSEENLDTTTSFTDFGLDSMLAIQYIELINKELKAELDATELFEYQNIGKLAKHLKGVFATNILSDTEFTIEKEKVRKVELMEEDIETRVLCLLKNKLSTVLEIQAELIDDTTSFMELGMDSILSTRFIEDITNDLNIDVDSTIVFECPNLVELTAYLSKEFEAALLDYLHIKNTEEVKTFNLNAKEDKIIGDAAEILHSDDHNAFSDTDSPAIEINERDIAIIGMACKFPGADTIYEFWENLKHGKSISEGFPMGRIDNTLEIYQSEDYKKRADSLYGSYVSDIDKFDPLFFEISPKEAEFMDPQQRLMLEVIWQAFEHASLSKENLSGTNTGVFVGACITEYMKYLKSYEAVVGTGNELSILSNRISYLYNLTGPSITVDTACSSSLVALDLACQNILSGRCGMAVVGGVNLILTPAFSIIFEKAGMLSKEGTCKTFDESADGYLRGEGAGAILLKPLKQAIEHGDNILAVLKGISVNQDGHSNGLTAPNTLAQKEVIQSAWEKGGIHPRTITMVEAHGTGTSLGDPIEVKALSQAFRNYTQDQSYCALGSVKTNIGHLEPAAGISGIIKVVLSLMNKKLPPTCHFNRLNPLINVVDSPFYINDALRQWDRGEGIPRRAAVSSFGFGGTNVHAVLEEAPEIKKDEVRAFDYYAIPVSAKQPDTLITRLLELRKYIATHKEISMRDFSYSLFTGTDHYSYRTCFVVQDIHSLEEQLTQMIANKEKTLPKVKKVSGKVNTSIILGDRWQFGNSFDVRSLINIYPPIEKQLDEIGLLMKKYMDIDMKQMISFEEFIRLHSSHDQKDLYIFLFNYLLGRLLIMIGLTNVEFFGIGIGAVAAKALKKNIHLEDCMKDISILCSKECETYKKMETMNQYIAYSWGETRERFPIHTSQDYLYLFLGESIYTEKGNQVMITNRVTDSVALIVIKMLSYLYERGCKINWQEYFKYIRVYKMPLPGYPLARKSYWAGRNKHEKEYVFIKKALTEKTRTEQMISHKAYYILIGSDKETVTRLESEFQSAEIKYLTIELVDTLEQDKNSIVQKLEQAIHSKDISGINLEAFQLVKIVYVNTHQHLKNEPEDKVSVETDLHEDIIRIFTLVRYLDSKSLEIRIELIHVMNQTDSYLDTAAAYGASVFSRILPYEFSNVRSKEIVLDSDFKITEAANEIISSNTEECVYLKEGKRFVEFYTRLESIGESAFTKENCNPVVIVTGGLSGIGYEICKYLLKDKHGRLVIIGRTNAAGDSETVIGATKQMKALTDQDKHKNLVTLKELSPMVQYIQGNVSDYPTLLKVFETARKTYGKIDAVIHCAGIIDSQHISIRSKSEASIRQVLFPKINGTRNLGILAEDFHVKKVILFSSLAALSGVTGVGFSDYAAANAFMDAYAESYHLKAGYKILSVNWPVWEKTGMSGRGLTTKQGNNLLLEEAMEAFNEIFESDYTGNLIVAGKEEADRLIDTLTKEHTNMPSLKIAEIKETESIEGKIPQDLAVNKAQAILTDLLKNILKLSDNEIEYDINFSEFGIDSLSLADMLGGIETYYGRHFEPSIIIEYPTVNLLSQYLAQQEERKEQKELVKEAESVDTGSYHRAVSQNNLRTADILKMLYEGTISSEQALNYMLEHEAAD